MLLRQRQSRTAVLALLALTAALFVATAWSGAASAKSACVPANNVEAIIDDSGSMTYTDSNKLRVEAIKLLISKPANAKMTLGALEFGSDQSYLTPPVGAAVTLFAPQTVGPNANAMKAILDKAIDGDNGATDYNAAFALAKTDNPSANARIFITDGGHNEGDYANGHTPGPPTYVVGLNFDSSGTTPSEDVLRLKQIAADTGGVYYPGVDQGNIQATINKVDAAMHCQAVATTFTDNFTKVGQTKAKSVSVTSSSKSIDLTLTWANPLDAFTVGSLKLKVKGGPTISIAKKRLKVKRVSGKTYLSLHVGGLKRGKLSFKLRAKTLGSGTGAKVNLTTQVVKSRKK